MTEKEHTAPTPRADPTLPQRYAELVVDALVDAGLVQRDAFDQAVRIAASEILARQAVGDR